MRKTSLFMLITIFLAAILLRLGLAQVNREANDSHMFAIRFTLLTNKLAKKEQCGECFQPKLYHFTAAKFIKSLAIDKTDKNGQIVASQSINFLAGVIQLAVIWAFIYQLPIQNERSKLLSFALASLNPTLTSINAQATNDTFVITFGTLALYFAYRFLKGEKSLDLFLTITFSFLAVSSKTNGWIIVLAILGSLLIKLMFHPSRRINFALIACGYIIFVISAAFLNPLNQYIFNYQKYGSPIVITIEKKLPFPYFFTETTIPEAGILSIRDGFFTFKFLELLTHPYSPCENSGPSVCTSLWTQLYARNHSTTFFKYPPTWIIDSPTIYTFDRTIFIFALPVTLLFLYGALKFMRDFFRAVSRKQSRPDLALTILVILGCVGFIILYSLLFRKISYMKPIFLYPGYLAFILIFTKSLDDLETKFQGKIIAIGFDVATVILIVLYILDSYSLYHHLLITT